MIKVNVISPDACRFALECDLARRYIVQQLDMLQQDRKLEYRMYSVCDRMDQARTTERVMRALLNRPRLGGVPLR